MYVYKLILKLAVKRVRFDKRFFWRIAKMEFSTIMTRKPCTYHAEDRRKRKKSLVTSSLNMFFFKKKKSCISLTQVTQVR